MRNGHHAVVTASADELATVDGIGEKTAEKMKWAVQEPVVEHTVRKVPRDSTH